MLKVGDHREPGNESQRNADQVLIGERPAEEDEVRPEIEKLWCVNFGHMIRLVPEDNTSIDQNECDESGDQSDERVQDFDDVNQSLGLCR